MIQVIGKLKWSQKKIPHNASDLIFAVHMGTTDSQKINGIVARKSSFTVVQFLRPRYDNRLYLGEATME